MRNYRHIGNCAHCMCLWGDVAIPTNRYVSGNPRKNRGSDAMFRSDDLVSSRLYRVIDEYMHFMFCDMFFRHARDADVVFTPQSNLFSLPGSRTS